jgi:hypothetical protein
MNQNTSERGAGRMALGLILVMGVAGSADQTPLNWGMLPLALLALTLGLWGVSRMKYGPLLPRASRVLARLSKTGFQTPAVRRHALIYLRAASR